MNDRHMPVLLVTVGAVSIAALSAVVYLSVYAHDAATATVVASIFTFISAIILGLFNVAKTMEVSNKSDTAAAAAMVTQATVSRVASQTDGALETMKSQIADTHETMQTVAKQTNGDLNQLKAQVSAIAGVAGIAGAIDRNGNP